MKKLFLLLIFLGIVFFAFYAFKNKGREEYKKEEFVTIPREEKICAEYDKKGTEKEPYSVFEYLEIEIKNEDVSGFKNGTQSGPDMTNGYQGNIGGKIKGDILDVIFEYEIEGSKQKEQEKYLLVSDGIVKLRYELKEEGGILVPDLSTNPKEILYKKVDCKK
jgi:hypothetical protein